MWDYWSKWLRSLIAKLLIFFLQRPSKWCKKIQIWKFVDRSADILPSKLKCDRALGRSENSEGGGDIWPTSDWHRVNHVHRLTEWATSEGEGLPPPLLAPLNPTALIGNRKSTWTLHQSMPNWPGVGNH